MIHLIELIDVDNDRYAIKCDSNILGRQYDNNSEFISIKYPQYETEIDSSCNMIISTEGHVLDVVIVANEEPIKIKEYWSKQKNITIGFSFINKDHYIKNSEKKEFIFLPAQKPDSVVENQPEQKENINTLLSLGFVDSEIDDNYNLYFKNLKGKTVASVKLPSNKELNIENGSGTYSIQQKTEKVSLQDTDSDNDSTYEEALFANLHSIAGYENVHSLDVGLATGEQGAVAFGWQGLSAGERSASFGGSNLVFARRGFAANTKNIVTGTNGTAFGSFNIVKGQNAFSTGYYTQANAPYSVSFNKNNIAGHWASAVFGEGNETSTACQALFGRYTKTMKTSDKCYDEFSLDYMAEEHNFDLSNTPIVPGSVYLVMRASENSACTELKLIDSNKDGKLINFYNNKEYGTINYKTGKVYVNWYAYNSYVIGLLAIVEYLFYESMPLLFAVGNGLESSRSNAFAVFEDGHAEVPTQGSTGNSIVLKRYLDAELLKKSNFNSLISGTQTMGVRANATNTKSTARYAYAFGENSQANGAHSGLFGNYCYTNAPYTFVAGFNNDAKVAYQTVIGRNANTTTDSSMLFVIGNGSSSSSKNNAFSVSNEGGVYAAGDYYSNGDVVATRVWVTDKKYITTEAADKRYELKSSNSYSTATYLKNGSGVCAITTNGEASANYAVSLGLNTKATGYAAIATGVGDVYLPNLASGDSSFVTGRYNQALAMGAFAGGRFNTAYNPYQFVIGKHSKTAQNDNRLFIIGNGTGTSESARSNAFEVYEDGHAEVQVQGDTNNSVVLLSTLNNVVGNINSLLEVINTGTGV